MTRIQTAEDVYPAVDELVARLKAAGQLPLAIVLHHRMHEVAWTTRSELFEELRDVLTGALKSDETELPAELKQQMERMLLFIRDFLKAQT